MILFPQYMGKCALFYPIFCFGLPATVFFPLHLIRCCPPLHIHQGQIYPQAQPGIVHQDTRGGMGGAHLLHFILI